MKNIKTIVLEDAKKVISCMEKECFELKIDCSFCVLDCTGNIVILEKMDNASIATLEIAEAKAVTALKTFLSTREVDSFIREKDIESGYLAGVCKSAIWGGFPLFENKADKIPAGAIGVCGGTWEQDEAIAKAGIKALDFIIK
jgi:uncharacterized protein GlcG (DUF336 family)